MSFHLFISEDGREIATVALRAPLRKNIRPAAMRAGINKLVGWHTIRRAASGTGNANQATTGNIAAANSRITLDLQ